MKQKNVTLKMSEDNIHELKEECNYWKQRALYYFKELCKKNKKRTKRKTNQKTKR